MLQIVLLDTEKLPRTEAKIIEERLQKLGQFTFYTTTNVDEVVTRCSQAEIILVNKNVLNEGHFKQLANLKYIVVIATGYDNVDVAAAKKYGIKVSNIPDYSTLSVAQHTIALLLELTNRVGKVNLMVKDGKWYGTGHKNLEVYGLTLGVFGFGNIAKCVIKIALSLGMKVLVCGSKGSKANYVTDLPVTFVDKEAVFSQSDVISLHCPVTELTQNLINKDSLALMKKECLLVNAARGKLVNERDLYDALLSRQISGAALDVVNQEPINMDNPLLTLDNCVFSPHNAWVSAAALGRWVDIIENNVKHYLQGKFINLV